VRITSVEINHVREISYPRPLEYAWSPHRPFTGMLSVVLRLHTDEGLTGIGAGFAAPRPLVQEYLIGDEAVIQEARLVLDIQAWYNTL
jgi:L-alanine-DL-glutamate epimerase-like enolase superfamily enzyme